MFLDFTSFKPLRNFIASFGRKAEPLNISQINQRDSQRNRQDNSEAESSVSGKTPPPTPQPTDVLKPVAYNPPEGSVPAGMIPNPNMPQPVYPTQQTPANQNQEAREGEAEWIEDPDHKLTPSEVSEKFGGKQGFRTEKGWSIHDPAKEPQQQQAPTDGAPSVPQEQEGKTKPKKPEPLDVNTITPEKIQEVQNSFHEFHRPPTEEEKQKIKDDTNQQINTFIDAVLEGRSNEATLPEMNQDEQVAFFISLFMAERAKMVAGIKITGRNRQKVAWAKELQRKIVSDLSNKANEYMNGAVKAIAERKEKPASFGGSLAELTRDDKPITDQKTPENYVREYSSEQGDKSKWSYNKRPYTQGIDVTGLTDSQLSFAGNIRNSILNGLNEQSEKLENTNLEEDLNVERGITKDGLKTIGKTTVTIGQNPPSPNATDSMVISFGLSSNPAQIKEALGKILKALDKKNLGSILELGSSTDIALNSDNVRIKARNWEELQAVHKIVEKQLEGISGADTHIEDNRYGLTESETVDILADIKSQMKNNNGTFRLYGENQEVKSGEDNKLSKVALVAKMLGSKVVDNGDGTFSLMALLQPNSSAFNNGITVEDSDEQALQKIKDAEAKDAQTPPPITDDPNSDIRDYLPYGWGKARQQRTKAVQKPAKQPKPVVPPKTTPASPQPELPVQQEPVLPTVPGVSTYVPSVKDASDLETEVSGITDWTSQEAKNLISDFNATLQSSMDNYELVDVNYLKNMGDEINQKIQDSGIDAMLVQERPQTEKVNLWKHPADFQNTKGLAKKGVRGVFEIQLVQSRPQKDKIKQLVQFFSKGKDKYKSKGNFDPLNDGIWTQGKNGEYFSGWCETKDVDGETTVFVSYDKELMFTVPKGKDFVGRAYVMKNPYLATGEAPRISNMEDYYNSKDFVGHSLPMTHKPDAENLKQFSVKYPALSMSDPDGRTTLIALLSYKHKLLSIMAPEIRKTAIRDGFSKAVTELYKGSPISNIKKMFLDSKSEVDGKSQKEDSLSDEQKNLVSSVSDEDFMKILSSIQVERGNEDSSKAPKYDSLREKQRLTSDNVEKYLKAKGIDHAPVLEYIASRPSGIFNMPEKGDTYYREIMDLPAHIRNRLVGTKKSQGNRKLSLDELAKEFSGGLHHNKGNERYTGTGGTENFLNDAVQAITDFYKENKSAEQAELDHYDTLAKGNREEAKKLLATPSNLSKEGISDGTLYKINGQVYMAVNDPDHSDWIFRGVDGDKPLAQLFNGKDKIQVEGAIPKSSDAWDVIGSQLVKKTEGQQEETPVETPYQDEGMEDILQQDNYDGSGQQQETEYNPLDDSDLPEEFREGNENFLSQEKKNKKASIVKHRRGFSSLKGLEECP